MYGNVFVDIFFDISFLFSDNCQDLKLYAEKLTKRQYSHIYILYFLLLILDLKETESAIELLRERVL